MTRRPPPLPDRREPLLPAGPAPDGGAMPRLRSMRSGGDGGGQWRHEPRQEMAGWPSWLMWTGVGLVALGAAVAGFLAVATPGDLVRAQIVREVKARTGRDLVVAGATSVMWYPALGLRLAEASLSAPSGMGGPPTLTAASLEVQVRLLPLLAREVIVERLVLVEPVLDLRVDRQGRRSWDLAATESAGDTTPVRLAQASAGGRTDAMPPELRDFVKNASDPDRARRGAGAATTGLSLGDVRLERATVRYHDEQTGVRHEASPVNVALKLAAIASPLAAEGDLVWKGEPVTFKLSLSTLGALMEDRTAKVDATLRGRLGEARYDGDLALRNGLVLDGQLRAATPSVKALSGLLGAAPPQVRGLGAASVAGALKATPARVDLAAAVIALDGATANGTLGVELSGARPHVMADLRLSHLDLDLYRPGDDGATPSPRQAPGAPALRGTQPPDPSPAAPDGAAPPRSIEDLLKRTDGSGARTGTRVLGFSRREGWSDAPLDASGLGLVDASLRLSAGRMTAGQIALGRTLLVVALKNRAMRATFEDIQLYDGRGRGLVTIDATEAAPSIGANFQLEGISTQPLLKDAAGLDWLAGRGRLALAVGTRGGTERQLVQALNGKLEVSVSNGAIVGWNLGQMLRGLGQGRIGGLDKVATEKTDFSELTATFQIQSGIAQNRDLRMLSPLLRITGAGTVDLPQQRIDYVARPKLVASTAGQGGAVDLTGLEVPLKISGSIDDPRVAPDIEGLVKDPTQAVDAVKQIGRQLRDGKLGDALKGFLGGR